MPGMTWRWYVNLALDLIGYYLRVIAWIFFVWVPVAVIIALLKTGAPRYLVPVFIVCSVLFGFISRWFSNGVFERRLGRMWVLTLGCLFIFAFMIIFLVSAPTNQRMAVAIQSIQYLLVAAILLVGVSKHKALSAVES